MDSVKIRRATRAAFLSIAAMMLAFTLVVTFMLLPMGLDSNGWLWAVRLSLYALVFFALIGGLFSIRVFLLKRKDSR
ncbi:cytochrome b6 [Neisseria sp. S1]|uniref:cytochrome b6 n=1 Tax=Neisseria sp. S1 TaxID=3318354 RepID=UPI003A8B5EB7